VSPATDSGDGLLMFFVFIAAVLTSTGAVALIALVDTWWALGLGFAIHVVMTALVVLTIVQVMAGRARATTERDRPWSIPDARPGAQRSRPATAL
jgi:membrane protein implicated in regulation of membrane protease activity